MHPASECYRVEYGAPFAPLWLPKNNEFFLDRNMYQFIRSTILVVQESVTIVEDVHYGIPLIAKIGNGFP